VGEQLRAGSADVLGVMLESHLVAGRQELTPGSKLVYGQSVTDACIDFPTTERLLERLASDVMHRKPRQVSA
jgi:3-deoxy-7-phosphoheptulonate synthase